MHLKTFFLSAVIFKSAYGFKEPAEYYSVRYEDGKYISVVDCDSPLPDSATLEELRKTDYRKYEAYERLRWIRELPKFLKSLDEPQSQFPPYEWFLEKPAQFE